MKIKFYTETKHSVREKRTIWCYVRENNNTLTLNTGQEINPAFWDKKLKKGDPAKTKNKILKAELNNLNQYLAMIESKIFSIEREVRGKDFGAGFGKIQDAIKSHFNKKNIGFFDIYDEFLSLKKEQVTVNQLSKYKRNKELLLKYQKVSRERLDFEKITPLLLEKFRIYLVTKEGMINNTAYKHITLLKTFLIWSNDNNFTNNNSYKSFKGKSEANEVIFLTEKELMSLYNLEIEEERLKRVRDIFIFQCFTGVRYSDIKQISREDIINATWKVRTQKTRQIIEIPLNYYALSILKKYRDFPQPLPIISNQKMNEYLKELCKKAEIDEPTKIIKYRGIERIETTYKKYEVIGTHTARRTFISLSLQKGMKPDVIMAITGHKTYRMMQRYLKIADTHKREEMDKVWGSNLRIVK